MVLTRREGGSDDIIRRRFREEQRFRLRTKGLPPELEDSTVPAEHLAAAQEAMRDRMDLTGIAAS